MTLVEWIAYDSQSIIGWVSHIFLEWIECERMQWAYNMARIARVFCSTGFFCAHLFLQAHQMIVKQVSRRFRSCDVCLEWSKQSNSIHVGPYMSVGFTFSCAKSQNEEKIVWKSAMQQWMLVWANNEWKNGGKPTAFHCAQIKIVINESVSNMTPCISTLAVDTGEYHTFV